MSLPFVSLGSGPGTIIISENGESMNDLRWRERVTCYLSIVSFYSMAFAYRYQPGSIGGSTNRQSETDVKVKSRKKETADRRNAYKKAWEYGKRQIASAKGKQKRKLCQ